MGHRALIAYERPDSLYNIHYTHWGGLHLRVKVQITKETPFGGEEASKNAQRLFAALIESYDDETVSRLVENSGVAPTDIDHDPLTLAISLEAVLTEYLDYLHHEAFYIVDSDFEVTAYRTHWFWLQYDCQRISGEPTVGNGALRTVRWYNGEPVGDGYAQGEFRALKRVAGDLCDRELFSPGSTGVSFRDAFSVGR
ncbi:DUF6735 family protein [Halomicroarcula sp. GCM10025709]|uniref:DUF6735 family protein n=1 Tax=Halomicroarcula sp. GCM10025709 TaxID=3252669 RepID=UPI003618F999